MEQDGLQPVYAWLRSHHKISLPATWVPGASISELNALAALGAVAATLLNGQTVPSMPTAVSTWMQQAPGLPVELADSIRGAYDNDPDGFLADLYAGLVLPSHRRRLGTFFTPVSEVQLMLRMWDEHAQAPNHVVDVGAGVGVFTAAAARNWPTAHVHAIDVNPVTLGLLAARLYGPNQDHHNVSLVCDDFTEWIADQHLDGPKLILGNPPYTRAQLLPIQERRRLQALTLGLCGSRASLSTVITALSLLRLGPQDGLCLLLPAQWLESDYARELRRTIWESTRRHVELRLVESALFADAQVDAVALLVGPETSKPALVLALWDESNPTAIQRDNATPTPPNWRQLFTRDTAAKLALGSISVTREAAQGDHMTLGEVATIKRGLATGANSFFTLSATQRKQNKIGRWTRRRIVTRLRDVPSETLTEETDQTEEAMRWILEVRRLQVEAQDALRSYVKDGEQLELHDRVLCERRSDWYDLTEEVVIPDVIVGPMTRGRFRLVENHIKAAITNNLYGLIWDVRVPDRHRNAVLDWLRSAAGQDTLKSIARQQGDGLNKIEPKALTRLALPADISSALRRTLAP